MYPLLIALTTVAQGAIDFSFLPGYWLSCDNGRETSEMWTDPRAGVLVGNSISFRGGEVSWEHVRIAPGRGGYTYYAQPSDQPAAEFRLVRHRQGELVFENARHDFPQRVIYRRAGNGLTARIEGMANGKPQAMEWNYRAAPLNTRCRTGPIGVPRRPKLRG
jgi:uncharacterized protein DUF6265